MMGMFDPFMMGMFDSFILDKKIPCPKCHIGLLQEFQTKELDCMLNEYYIGDELNLHGLKVCEGEIVVYDYCQECKTRIYGLAKISKGVFTGINEFRWDEDDIRF